jgi:hypothetical protein
MDPQVSLTVPVFRSRMEARLHITDGGNWEQRSPLRTRWQPVGLLRSVHRFVSGRSVTLYACVYVLGLFIVIIIIIIIITGRPLKWLRAG